MLFTNLFTKTFKLSAPPWLPPEVASQGPQAAGHDIGMAERGGDLPVCPGPGDPGLFVNCTPGQTD